MISSRIHGFCCVGAEWYLLNKVLIWGYMWKKGFCKENPPQNSAVKCLGHMMCQGHQLSNVSCNCYSVLLCKGDCISCKRKKTYLSTAIWNSICQNLFQKRVMSIMFKGSWGLTLWVEVCFSAELFRVLNVLTCTLQYSVLERLIVSTKNPLVVGHISVL